MRVVSLLPSATEIVFALGLGSALVGVTHECDYPEAARGLPVVTHSLLDHSDATSAEIDQAVSTQLPSGVGLYGLDEALLAELRPDLILTQSLCEVCAVSYGVVQRAVRDITPAFPDLAPQILSLEPSSLDDILLTITAVGQALGAEPQAAALVGSLRARIERVRAHTALPGRPPRVACLEWIDPLFGPGHWLPEMVSLAGGTPGLSTPFADSRRVSWSDVIAFAPEVLVATPCGFDLPRALAEALRVLPYRAGWEALPAVRGGRVYVVDGNAYFSRPGPRIVDSLELLAELIHPERCAGWAPPDSWMTLPGSVVSEPAGADARGAHSVAATAGLPTEE